MQIEILVGDCRTRLLDLQAESVNMVVTSPPYFGLRDYDAEGQIGLENTVEEYVAELVGVFREVRRVLRRDGTLWLNLGDTYSRATGRGGKSGRKNAHTLRRGSSDAGVRRAAAPAKKRGTLAEKQLVGVPWRVAFALQADGWYLRQDIIWAKPNPIPESVSDRCTKAHEYMFLLSREPIYHFDFRAIEEPANYPAGNRNKRPSAALASDPEHHRTKANIHKIGARKTRRKRSVWTIASEPFVGDHHAVFPRSLVEPCILAGCPIGGTVLDPFGGAGTTGLVANRLQRNAILIEINEKSAAMARERIGSDGNLLARFSA